MVDLATLGKKIITPMSHNHNCAHEHEHDHDHGHDHHEDTNELGFQDNLYARIDKSNVVALNASGDGQEVIKPWNERLEEDVFLESDADDQMIIRIPFTGSVKLHALLLKTGPAEQTPAKVSLFTNDDGLDFDDVGDKKPLQDFDIPQGREVGKYALKPVKFSSCSSVTLFFPASQGAETIKIFYVGFLGQWTERKENPIITVYEAQANPADHDKVQGTDSAWSAPQH